MNILDLIEHANRPTPQEEGAARIRHAEVLRGSEATSKPQDKRWEDWTLDDLLDVIAPAPDKGPRSRRER